ncbi:MAG: metallophosphoesterase family protein [Chloroflexi bacterium]|nr:metallophosphoesterase family protein [Chloroflexota bacterium]
MRIGLITDTHVPEVIKAVPDEVAKVFSGVDLILHAGDIYARTVLDDLERIAPVLAARGDDDYISSISDKRVQEKHVLKLEGKTVWLVHELPYEYRLHLWQSKAAVEDPGPDAPDVIVFGHEHSTILKQVGKTLLVNSGSATFLHYRYGLGTVGILSINGSGTPQASIIQL